MNAFSSLSKFAGVVVVTAFLSGCGVYGVVTDVNKTKTNIDHITFSEGEYLTMYDGSGVRRIKLKEISKVTIKPQIMETFDGKPYYVAEILTSAGTKFGSFKERESKVYIQISGTLSGRCSGGDFSIPLDRIAEIELFKE